MRYNYELIVQLILQYTRVYICIVLMYVCVSYRLYIHIYRHTHTHERENIFLFQNAINLFFMFWEQTFFAILNKKVHIDSISIVLISRFA